MAVALDFDYERDYLGARERREWKELVKLLGKAEALAHQGIHRTFEAWLDASLLAYEQWRTVEKPNGLLQTEEALNAALDRARFLPAFAGEEGPLVGYHPDVREYLRQAFVLHQRYALETFCDILGPAYEELGHGNKWMAQYFTPWNLAKMMAEMTMDHPPRVPPFDPTSENQHPAWDSWEPFDWGAWGPPPGPARLLARIRGDKEATFTPEKPCTICDPAVGAGVMLLAAASEIPPWALIEGRTAFYGMDLDMMCVKMCRLNMIGRGLGARADAQTLDDLSDAQLTVAAAAISTQSAQYEQRIMSAPPEAAREMVKQLKRTKERGMQLGLFAEQPPAVLPDAPPRKRSAGRKLKSVAAEQPEAVATLWDLVEEWEETTR